MRPVNPWLKAALDYGPLILFFVIYTRFRDQTVMIAGRPYSGFILATLVLVPVSVAATLALWRLTGRLSVMQVVTIVLLVVFGGLSVWLNDPRFLKVKLTIIYLLFAGTLGLGLALRRNWLQLVLGEAMPLRPEGWRILTGRLALLFLALALANEAIWRLASEATWVRFKIFGAPLILFGFFLAHGPFLRRHAPEGAEGGTGPADRP